MITFVFCLRFSRYNNLALELYNFFHTLFWYLCGCKFLSYHFSLCTASVLFGGSFALFFPRLKCLIPNFPLSFTGQYVLVVHEVTMPLFLGQTLTPAFKFLNFSRENQNQEQRFFQSHQQGKMDQPHSQGSYPRHTEVNGIFPIECSGRWIQSLHPSHPCNVSHEETGLQFWKLQSSNSQENNWLKDPCRGRCLTVNILEEKRYYL